MPYTGAIPLSPKQHPPVDGALLAGASVPRHTYTSPDGIFRIHKSLWLSLRNRDRGHYLAESTFREASRCVRGTAWSRPVCCDPLYHESVCTIIMAWYVSLMVDIILFYDDSAEPLQTKVHAAFAKSLATIWQAMIGIAGVAFIASLFVSK